jgi:hypothetical protein
MTEEGGDLLDIVAGLLAEHGGGVAQGVDGDVIGIQTSTAGVLLDQAPDLAG